MSTERKTFEVQAKPWEHGYELHIADVGVTQARSLDEAEEVVRDFISLDLDAPADSFDVVICAGAA
jgi:hypothetical protein